MSIQTKPDNELIENIMHQHFKAWGFRVGTTSRDGHTFVYVNPANFDFVRKILRKFNVTVRNLNS